MVGAATRLHSNFPLHSTTITEKEMKLNGIKWNEMNGTPTMMVATQHHQSRTLENNNFWYTYNNDKPNLPAWKCHFIVSDSPMNKIPLHSNQWVQHNCDLASWMTVAKLNKNMSTSSKHCYACWNSKKPPPSSTLLPPAIDHSTQVYIYLTVRATTNNSNKPHIFYHSLFGCLKF